MASSSGPGAGSWDKLDPSRQLAADGAVFIWASGCVVGIPDKGWVPGRREAFDEWRVFHREPTHR